MLHHVTVGYTMSHNIATTLYVTLCYTMSTVTQVSEKKRTGSTSEEEATLRPGALRPPSPSSTEGSSWSAADSKVLATLTEHLRTFCLTAEKLK